jgi:transcriptional regulator with XRE-family HTH domain
MAISTDPSLPPVHRNGNVIDMPRRLPNRLREWRRANGLTLEQLAARLETTNQTLSRYELGKRSLTIDLLEQIAPVLGCRPADLLPDPESSLDDRERRMLRAFKTLGPGDGDYLVKVAEALAQAEHARTTGPLVRRRA